MKYVKYTLDSSAKKYTCPKCRKKTLVVYVDSERNRMTDKDWGRCDREDKCGYFVKPDSNEADILDALRWKENKKPVKKHRFDFVNSDFTKSTLFRFVSNTFGISNAMESFSKYRVGLYEGISNNDWSIFWQIDVEGTARTAKIIRYGIDGKRMKSDAPTWWHKLRENEKEGYEVEQCLFGLHLGVSGKIAVVESEKTAIIASICIPSLTWMATGGKSNFRLLKDLKNCNVTLFPDLGAYSEWYKVAIEYGFGISKHIENIANEQQRAEGWDIADFLIWEKLNGK